MQNIVLCADIGTSALKAAFIDISECCAERPRLAAFIREEYTYTDGVPQKFPSVQWEDAFRRALAALYRQQPDVKCEAICISGNGPTLVPMTKDGSFLPPLHWFGHTRHKKPVSSFFLPHVLAFKEHYREYYENTSVLFSCQEWLSYRLGAEPVTVLPTSEYTPFYWDDAQCAELEIDIKLFPRFAYLGEIIGVVSTSAAKNFKLCAGTPIIAGGPDFIMALHGSGAVLPGLVCDRAGSSEGINICLEHKPALNDSRFRILPHAVAGYWNISVVLPESGILFERWRTENGYSTIEYDKLFEQIINNACTEAPPVLYTIAAQVKDAIDTLGAAGFPVSEMRLSGGQAKNPRWNALKAKLTGCTLLALEIPDAELSGDAAAAMTALGRAATITQAGAALLRIERRYTP